MSALKLSLLIFAILFVTYSQPGGFGGFPGARPPRPGGPPPGSPNQDGFPPNNLFPPNDDTGIPDGVNPNGLDGIPNFNDQARNAANTAAKIKILIRILKILRKLNLPCWLKTLLKRLPLNLLQKLLQELLKADIIEKIKNIYDLLKLLKDLGIPIPFPFVFVPPCSLGQNVQNNNQDASPQQCNSWQAGLW